MAAGVIRNFLRPLVRAPVCRGTASRYFAEMTATPRLSKEAESALGSIKATMQAQKKVTQVNLTKAQKKNFPGHLKRYICMGGRPEFHNMDRNRYGRIFEPWHNFEVKITSSKNNCWIAVKNKSWRHRCVIVSHAGNVGFRGAMKKSEACTYAIGLNIAKKLRRLGVTCAEVQFKRLMKVETVLQAFQNVGLQITKMTHLPGTPHGNPHKPRKPRRV
mmetsp:Transcript_1659/g.2785  ORF Transcript_1659/g.2785 Transcript_1659/m.2785 type:complete len:217 (+) Transcript_1659:80-730(+)